MLLITLEQLVSLLYDYLVKQFCFVLSATLKEKEVAS